MWIYTKAAISSRPTDMDKITVTRPGTFSMGLTNGYNKTPWSSKNAKIVKSLQVFVHDVLGISPEPPETMC